MSTAPNPDEELEREIFDHLKLTKTAIEWDKGDIPVPAHIRIDYQQAVKKIGLLIKSREERLVREAVTAKLLKLKEEMKMHTVPEGRDLITRSYLNNSIDFEIAALEEGE